MKNKTLKTKDFLRELIDSLSIKEKNIIEKYLHIYKEKGELNSPLNIYKVYLSESIYHEVLFQKKSKCSSIAIFKIQKGILKQRILDALRIAIHSNDQEQFLIWRKKIDQAVLLRKRGNQFWNEAIKILHKVMIEADESNSNAYVLLAEEEISVMSAYIKKKSSRKISFYENIKKNTLKSLRFNDKIEDLFREVVPVFVSSKFVKENNAITLLQSIKSNELLLYDLSFYPNKFQQINITIIKATVSFLENNQDSFQKELLIFESLYNQLDPKKWYFTKEYQTLYLHLLLIFLNYTNFNNKIKNYITKYRKNLSNSEINIGRQPIIWMRYYQFIFDIKIKKSTLEKIDIDQFKTHYNKVSNILLGSVKQGLLFSILKSYYFFKNYETAYNYSVEILNIDTKDSITTDLFYINKLVELSTLFIHVLATQNILNNIERLKTIGSTHYSFFKRKDPIFYKFEMKLCSFFKSIDINYNKGIKKQLIILKADFKKIEKTDQYGFIEKLNKNYFDFYIWIDDCIKHL